MSDAMAAASPAAENTVQEQVPASLLDQIVEEARFREPAAKERGRDLIKDFLENVLQGQVTVQRTRRQWSRR
jgi:type VI secretion system protein ImpC